MHDTQSKFNCDPHILLQDSWIHHYLHVWSYSQMICCVITNTSHACLNLTWESGASCCKYFSGDNFSTWYLYICDNKFLAPEMTSNLKLTSAFLKTFEFWCLRNNSSLFGMETVYYAICRTRKCVWTQISIQFLIPPKKCIYPIMVRVWAPHMR